MEGTRNRHSNNLLLYRRRMGFSQKYVATLLGHKDEDMISRYENGVSMPPSLTLLKLEIIYRVPAAFLYGQQYDSMREKIRIKEEKLVLPQQGVLF